MKGHRSFQGFQSDKFVSRFVEKLTAQRLQTKRAIFFTSDGIYKNKLMNLCVTQNRGLNSRVKISFSYNQHNFESIYDNK